MADESEFIIKLKGDISDVVAQLDLLAKKIGDTGKNNPIPPNSATLGYLEKLNLQLDELKRKQQQAHDVTEVKKYNSEIKKLQNQINDLTGVSNVFVDKLKSIQRNIIAAFSVNSIINFMNKLEETNEQIEAITIKAQALYGKDFPALRKEAEQLAASLGLTKNEFIAARTNMDLLAKNMGFTQTQAARMSNKLLEVANTLSLMDKQGRSSAAIAEDLQMALAGNTRGLRDYSLVIKSAKVQLDENGDSVVDLVESQRIYNEILQQTTVLTKGLNTELVQQERDERNRETRIKDLTEKLAEQTAWWKESKLEIKLWSAELLSGLVDGLNGVNQLEKGFDKLNEQMGRIAIRAGLSRSQAIRDAFKLPGADTIAGAGFENAILNPIKPEKPDKEKKEKKKKEENAFETAGQVVSATEVQYEYEKAINDELEQRIKNLQAIGEITFKNVDKQEEVTQKVFDIDAKVQAQRVAMAKEANLVILDSFASTFASIASIAEEGGDFQKLLTGFQITLNLAASLGNVIQAATKAAALTGPLSPLVLAGYIAQGTATVFGAFAEIYQLTNKPTPKAPNVQRFAKGTDWVTGGQWGQDSVPAILMPGERVVTTKMNDKYYDPLQAIHEDKFDQFIVANYLAPALREIKVSAEQDKNSLAENIAKSIAVHNNFTDTKIVMELQKNREVSAKQNELLILAMKEKDITLKRSKK